MVGRYLAQAYIPPHAHANADTLIPQTPKVATSTGLPQSAQSVPGVSQTAPVQPVVQVQVSGAVQEPWLHGLVHTVEGEEEGGFENQEG